MNTHLGHIQVNVAKANLGFYKDLFGFLGWPTLSEDEAMLGVSGKSGDSLWFGATDNDAANDYDGPGMNHLGIGAGSQADVDETVKYLLSKSIPPLFETPRHRPEFASSESETYYQVMFESPDRVLFEVVYAGPKQ